MKGIRCCGECANYSYKKHACTICTDEGKPTDSFYADCPLPDVVERVRGEWLDRRKEDCCTGEEPCAVGMVNGEPYASCFCSVCGEWLVASDEYPVKGNFCPNCGCQMVDEVKK